MSWWRLSSRQIAGKRIVSVAESATWANGVRNDHDPGLGLHIGHGTGLSHGDLLERGSRNLGGKLG